MRGRVRTFAARGARPDCGWSPTGDSVGGRERRPRQRRGFGEESPPKPLSKAQTETGDPDVAVTQIRGLFGGKLIFALQGGELASEKVGILTLSAALRLIRYMRAALPPT